MNKKRSSALSSLTEQITANMERAEGRPSHRPMPAPTQLVHFDAEFQKTAEELDRLKKAGASGFEIPLDKLRSSPFQVAPLDEERVVGLVENLRQNPQSAPVVVRPLPDGYYELIAGHHRTEAFRRLGRATIRGISQDVDDDAAQRLVFYDNLLAPSLTDYEKYLGFSKRKEVRGFSLAELATEAGISKAQVGFLFQFEKLPQEAQELIKQRPRDASARLFRELAPLAETHEAKVVEAVRKVLEGALAVTEVGAWVRRTGIEKPASVAVEKTVIKAGKQTYAEIRCRESQVVVRFANNAEAAAVALALAELLKQRAEAAPDAG